MPSSRWHVLAAAAAVLVVAAGCSSGVSNSKFNAEKARAAEAEAAAVAAAKEAEAEKTRADQLAKDLAAANEDAGDVARPTFDLAEAEKEAAAAKKKADDLTAKLKGTEADGKETYDRLTFDLAEAEKELEDAKEEVNSLTSEKNDLTAKLKGTEDDAKEEYDRVTSELAEAEKELKDAKEEVNSLTSEKNDLTAELKGTKDDAKEEYDRVTSELAEAEKKLEDAKEEVNSLTSEKNDLTAKLKGTEDDAKEEYDRVTSELAEAEKELKDAKEEVNSLTSEKNDLTAELKGTEDDAKEEYDRVTSELAEAEKKLEDAKEEVNSLTSEKNDLTAELKGTKDDAKEEYDHVTSELAEAEKKLEDAKEKVNSLTSEAAMVRFGFIVANPGEVFYAINTASNGATVPITLKKTDDGLKLGGFGEDLDETKLRLPAIADFVGAEFRDERADEDGGTTEIRVVSWSDVKTLSTLGDAPLYSGGDKAMAGWDWNKVDPSLKRSAGDESEGEEYVVEAGSLVQGTYDNVPGVFTCERRDPGEFCSTGATSGGGVFKFTPKADYLSFGAWMSKSSAEGNAPSSPVVGVFAVGGSLTPITEAKNNTGTATYKGGATGFYAKREVGAGAGAGAYTADVELRADFENEGIVSGSVTNFQEMRTGTALGWSVKLDRAEIDTTKKARPFEGDTSGQANFDGDEEDLNGKWEGKFYGQDASSAAGTFNARTGDPADGTKHYLGVIGAFGAKKEMPQPSAQ